MSKQELAALISAATEQHVKNGGTIKQCVEGASVVCAGGSAGGGEGGMMHRKYHDQ